MELDSLVGTLLKKLDDLGSRTYDSSSPATTARKPSAGRRRMVPFRGEKGTTFEGGFRVPGIARWPGVIKPNTIINDIFSQEDWLPTFWQRRAIPTSSRICSRIEGGEKTFKNILTATLHARFKGEVMRVRAANLLLRRQRQPERDPLQRLKIHFSWIEGNLFTGSAQR